MNMRSYCGTNSHIRARQLATTVHRIYYLLTPWGRVLLQKLTGLQLVKKFPAFYGTRRFITAFTSARHLSLSWASSIQSIPPKPTTWRSISHPCLGLPSGLFPPCFPTKTLNTPLPSPIRAACPAHIILLDFIIRTLLSDKYRTLSSPLCSFLHSPVTSSLLGPNTLLNTLFSNTLSLRSFLNVSDQDSHPYKTTSKIIRVLYVLIFKFFELQTGRQKILRRMIANIPWLQSALNFFLNRILIC